MGPNARRSLSATAGLLATATIILAVTGWGTQRMFLCLLFAAVVMSLWAVAAHLLRQDRGLIAALRLQHAAQRSTKLERSVNGYAEFTGQHRTGV